MAVGPVELGGWTDVLWRLSQPTDGSDVGRGICHQGSWPKWLKDGGYLLRSGKPGRPGSSRFGLCIQQEPASSRCVPATITGLGEQGGMVPALTEHRRRQAPRGGVLPRSYSELEKGWSLQPLPAPPSRMEGFQGHACRPLGRDLTSPLEEDGLCRAEAWKFHQEASQRGLELFSLGGDLQGLRCCLQILEGLFWTKNAPCFRGPCGKPWKDKWVVGARTG